ncbi:FkbM family methyltransferase [Lentimicrobium sp.]|uniref:FkbM family methyltransferase n=4 Tax=Lentimicrobium sp. TaxID=2034841 RepID=UPI0025F3D67A|nr:FkbM family methyltransferase [Lentimicrobium sp.]MCO5255926.1 FkbM family methyltransferase [Lentimicrobium sp.]MCO5263297.1 FkbM family methyltransferase [Lentimicrobium sp.]HPF63704.1 FkbM family methyltransferase [Lentimicrobium sp.]HPJ61273.1 FkbM family methyltransferase [Lentimicrobium sp.]HPR25040.1 FkbM family methyltransferase [Lentimicrobium sp.]
MNHLKDFLKTQLIKVFPSAYKKRHYRFLENLNWNNIPAEEGELLLMPYFLNDNTLFFDIGANTGIYTSFAQKFIPGESVYAFEPIPELYTRLKYLFRKSNIYKMAFSNEISEKQFKIPSICGKEFKSRGTLNVSYKENDETKSRVIDVSTDTIDSFVKKKNISKIGFVKIDVEGHELQVIEGGIETLKEQKPVLQIEIEQRHYQRNISEIIDFIKDAGYFCYYLDPKAWILKKLEVDPVSLQKEDHFKTAQYIHNFIFLPVNTKWDSAVTSINQDIRLARSGNY